MSVAKHEDPTLTDGDDSAGDALIGRTIAGKYEIVEKVGEGAMGSVYRATHRLLDKTVAVKVLHGTLTRDPAFKQRFQQEAQAASRLDHPNSVQVIDFGIEPDSTSYIVMEFLSGRSLGRVLAEEWPFTTARIVDVMSQVLSALATAHDAGIVHRDLKPENIMLVPRLDADGNTVETVKVADFGIAKMMNSRGDTAPKVTVQGMVSGTPEYMSPEQAQARPVDGRSDLYACGVILYEMVTGRLPFTAENVIAVAIMQVSTPPPPFVEMGMTVDPNLESVVFTALKKEPNDRFRDARAMRAALRALIDDGTGNMSVVAYSRPLTSQTPAVTAIDSVPMQREVSDAPTLIGTMTTLPATAAAPTSRGRMAAIGAAVALAGLVIASPLLRKLTVGPAVSTTMAPRAVPTFVPSTVPAPSAAPVAPVPVFAPPIAQTPPPPPVAPPATPSTPTPTTVARVAPDPRHRAMDPSHAPRAAHAPLPTVDAPTPSPVIEAPTPPPPTPPIVAAPQSVVAPTPPPSPVVAPPPAARPVTAIAAGLTQAAATNGVRRSEIEGRARDATNALGRCATRLLRTQSGSMAEEAQVTVTVEVIDRRADSVSLRGGPSWVASCTGDVRESFAGDLPAGENSEYTIRLTIGLNPQH